MLPAAPPRSIVIVRALPGLGDLLCAVPALRALRGRFPDARVSLVGLTDTEPLVRRFEQYVDELIPFPGWPGIPEVPHDQTRVGRFLRESRRRRFDLCLQMHGNGSSMASFARALGAVVTIGYAMPCRHAATGALRYEVGVSEVRRWLRLVELTGAKSEERLEFPLHEEDRAEAERLRVQGGVSGEFAVIHPGAADERRRWCPEGFAAVADALVDHGLDVVLTGSAQERRVTQAVTAASHASPVDLTGATGVGVLAALLTAARVVVCNDTGVAHLASAVGAPAAVIFTGAVDPGRWMTPGRALRVTVAPRDGDEVPDGPPECGGGPCPILWERPREPGEVQVAQVLSAVRRLLGDGRGEGRTHVA